jgi:hypothetical protein
MSTPLDRLNRERRTIQAMLEIYCRGHHRSTVTLCAECYNFLAYATQRIDMCPFQSDKPTCKKCPVHCYTRDMREKARHVMGYAGPRMMIFHPILTVLHYSDEITKKHDLKSKTKGYN